MGNINCSCLQNDQNDNKELLENGVINSEYSFNNESKRQTGVLQSSGKLKNKTPLYLKQNITNFLNLFQNKLNNNNMINNYSIEEISQLEFNNAINNNSQAQRTINLLNNFFSNVKYYGDNNIINLPPLKIINNSNNEIEYYEGFFDDQGNFCGIGTLITKDFNIYKGCFENNLFNGKGLLISKNGDYYYGDWLKGKCNGKGIIVSKDNITLYEGNFKNNKKNGKGLEHFSDGSVYIGEFKENEKNGKGKYIYKDGSYYHGDFLNDLFDGNGEYVWNDGRKYKGTFKKGAINGKGEFKWNDNSIYIGEYIDNIKQGEGKYIWPDGKKFFGKFENNQPNGHGFFEYNNERFDVVFENGKILSKDNLISSKKIKFKKNDIIINSNVNINDILCYKCQNLLDNPVECKECHINYCIDCVEDENKNRKKCLICEKNIYEKNSNLFQTLLNNIKVKCNQCNEILEYKNTMNHCH